jgi:hypothetical protein
MLNTLLLYPDHPATRPSSKANWRRRSTLPAGFTTSTSSRSMRTSNPEQSGVCPTRSLPHSRNWVPFRNSRLRRSWGSSWKLGFHSRSNPRGGSGRPPLLFTSECYAEDRRSVPTRLPEARFWTTRRRDKLGTDYFRIGDNSLTNAAGDSLCSAACKSDLMCFLYYSKRMSKRNTRDARH